MTATEGRIKPQSISDDVRAIEEALANKPERHGYRTGIDGSLDHARAVRDWSENIGAVTTPARLRRVLDTMRAMGGALDELQDIVQGLLDDGIGAGRIDSFTLQPARAALTQSASTGGAAS